jgi:hypothetical protein
MLITAAGSPVQKIGIPKSNYYISCKMEQTSRIFFKKNQPHTKIAAKLNMD